MPFDGVIRHAILFPLLVGAVCCAEPKAPERPASVPSSAVPHPWIAKSTLWVDCQKTPEVRCRMWDSIGQKLIDEVFVADDGRSVGSQELRLNPLDLSLDYVRLENRRVLFRSSAPPEVREGIRATF
jgi:hypothetical protein